MNAATAYLLYASDNNVDFKIAMYQFLLVNYSLHFTNSCQSGLMITTTTSHL